MTLEEKLAKLKNYHTRYEIVATNSDQTKTFLILYTARKSRPGLTSAIRQRWTAVTALIGFGDLIMGKTVSAWGGDWTVKFSGRTQREAICDGEHTFLTEHTAVTA